ncbi:MAG: hypothetical protein IKZ41_03510, partial [Clostridia bacterium]|nr:hypothetical protein [Clostridia bacterium]
MNEQMELFPGSEYAAFVDKFKPKKTTDDCYTPEAVYEAVADFVVNRYGIDRSRFVRPFWPGGDFERYDYKPGDVVVDNPPFSIFSAITWFYQGKGIDFFLFGPTLTLFSAAPECCVLPTGVGIIYENGADINTSFATSLEPGLRIATRPELFQAVDKANREEQARRVKSVPKYEYPDSVITAARAYQYAQHGVTFEVPTKECVKVRKLDAQDAYGKAIFGAGYLLSERCTKLKAAAEKAAAEKAAAEKAAAEKAAAEKAAAEKAAA